MTTNKEQAPFQNVPIPEGSFLRKKEFYEYTTPDNVYDIEVYFNQDDTCYAIGIPREGEKLIVYGTSTVNDAELALKQLLQKIQHQGFDRGFPPEF